MVGSHKSGSALVTVEALQVERPFEVNIIQPKHGERARKRAGPPEITANVRLGEMPCQRGSHGTAQPFIEVTEHDSRTAQLPVRHDFFVDEPVSLPALFEESRTEVDVEDVKRAAGELNVCSQATPGLPAAGADVVIPMTLDWKARQHDIAVTSAFVKPVLAKSEMESEFAGDKPRLVLFGRTPFQAHHFLKGDDVGIKLAQNTDNAVRPDAPIHATAFVNVVGSNSENRAGLDHI